MKRIIANSALLTCCLCLAALLGGCVQQQEFDLQNRDIQAEVAVRFSFQTATSKEVTSRAGIDDIDNVYLLIFQLPEGETLNDNTPVVKRSYIQYGIEQKVYLQSNQTYYIFAAANLDEYATPGGDVTTYFENVQTYGQLKDLYVIQISSLIPAKLMMTTDGLVEVNLPYMGEGMNMKLFLHRVQTQLELNIYNKVDPANPSKILSGVYPVSFTGLYVPVGSYLMERKTGTDKDFSSRPVFAGANASNAFMHTQNYGLPKPSTALADLVTRNGHTYTRQTVYGYIFENRQGDKTLQGGVDKQGNPYDPVYNRRAEAPEFATTAQIVSNTDSVVMLTYVMLGKGREVANNDPDIDNVENYDIDRNCVYHLNIYINGVKDVDIDTRRQYINQLVVLTLPDVKHIDAHYVDYPTRLTGNKGMAKFQSGTCDVDANGQIIYDENDPDMPRRWKPMLETDHDTVRWLRFSWRSPYYKSQAKTTHYSGLTDASTGATPILHFNEFTSEVQKDASSTTLPKRTAIIRIGYISNLDSRIDGAAGYEREADKGNENVFFMPISQWGMRSIGQVGGFDEQSYAYTSLLGVESIEEFCLKYYDDVAGSDGLKWNFTAGVMGKSHPYDGKGSTTALYDLYRDPFPGKVPPNRYSRDYAPFVGTAYETYDPDYNTFAADYCMRKNRDDDENGIIEGDEIKWYLPTPVQLMQISLWQSMFNYSLNSTYPVGYKPFSKPYWSTNESDEGEALALALDFAGTTNQIYTFDVKAFNKATHYPVRCVRDLRGKTTGIIYISTKAGYSYLAGDLTGHMPPTIYTDKKGWGDKDIAELANNAKMQTAMIISRYYVRSGTEVTMGDGGGTPCSKYSEGTETSGWRLPTQRELAFLYAYTGMIDNLLKTRWGTDNYDSFKAGNHWTSTNDGNGGHYWLLNFQTGTSQMYHKSKAYGYYRCVKYVGTGAYTADTTP